MSRAARPFLQTRPSTWPMASPRTGHTSHTRAPAAQTQRPHCPNMRHLFGVSSQGILLSGWVPGSALQRKAQNAAAPEPCAAQQGKPDNATLHGGCYLDQLPDAAGGELPYVHSASRQAHERLRPPCACALLFDTHMGPVLSHTCVCVQLSNKQLLAVSDAMSKVSNCVRTPQARPGCPAIRCASNAVPALDCLCVHVRAQARMLPAGPSLLACRLPVRQPHHTGPERPPAAEVQPALQRAVPLMM